MRFSIVIPTWEQHGKGVFFLSQLLTSIEEQTFTDFEVIISDHSKNDEIEDLSRTFSSLNIVYSRNSSNRGNSPANLNTGLSYAKGEIIKVMFQDDFFIEKYALERIDKTFKSTSCKWLVNGSCITEDSKNFTNHRIPQWTNELLEGRNSIGSPSVLSFVNENILFFNEELVMLMDCDYYYSLYKRYGLPCILENCLTVSTSHPYQISKMYDKDLKSEINLVKIKQL
jgi:glycosyltransferase involved in cell wall biosynthesis